MVNSRLLLGFCFLVGAGIAVLGIRGVHHVYGQTSPTTTTGIGFDVSGLDTNGQPDTLDRAEIGLFQVGGAAPVLTPAIMPAAPRAGTNTATLATMLSTVIDGRFDLRVRLRDTAGNLSVWSAPLTVEVRDHSLVLPAAPDTTPPATATRLRVVQVTVGDDGTLTMVVTP